MYVKAFPNAQISPKFLNTFGKLHLIKLAAGFFRPFPEIFPLEPPAFHWLMWKLPATSISVVNKQHFGLFILTFQGNVKVACVIQALPGIPKKSPNYMWVLATEFFTQTLSWNFPTCPLSSFIDWHESSCWRGSGSNMRVRKSFCLISWDFLGNISAACMIQRFPKFPQKFWIYSEKLYLVILATGFSHGACPEFSLVALWQASVVDWPEIEVKVLIFDQTTLIFGE